MRTSPENNGYDAQRENPSARDEREHDAKERREPGWHAREEAKQRVHQRDQQEERGVVDEEDQLKDKGYNMIAFSVDIRMLDATARLPFNLK